MPKSFSTFSRVFIGTFRLKRKWTRLCKRSAEWQMTLILYQVPIFCSTVGFRQTNVAACGQCGTLSGYYFFLNGRGCFADLYSSLIQGDGGGIAGIGIYVEYGAQHLCLHFIGRDDEGAVGVFGYFEACFSGEVYGAASLREENSLGYSRRLFALKRT